MDAALIQRVQAGAELPKTGGSGASGATLVERLGDTALVQLGTGATAGASVLVIRTKEGWRIRDYLTGAQATPAPAG